VDERLTSAIDCVRFETIADMLLVAGELCRRAAEAAEAENDKTMKVLLHEIVRSVRAACETAGELGTEGMESDYQ
jgi:hypothetical protein